MAKLRVMSWNVHGLRDDRAALTGLVREYAPDVLIVQEGPRRFRWRGKSAHLAAECDMVVGAGGLPSLGNLVLVNLRVKILQTWSVRFPLTPGRHLRGAAFLRGSVLGATFTASGSHLATDPVERPAQAARWRSELSALTGPVIAAADVNEGPDGASWRTVAEGFTPHASQAWTFPAAQPRTCLDAVFVSTDVTVDKYEVVDTAAARRASDHLPICVDLSLPSS